MDELKVKVNFENPVQVQAVQIPGLPGRDGRDGTPGKDGENGRDGKSAYEVAVDNGFVGTEQEWLESLKGRDGVSGTSEAVSMNFPTVYQMMKNRAMKVDSDSLEDLLKALLREVIPDGRYTSYLAEFKLVDGTSVAVGDTVVHVEGQPGFYVVDTNGNRQMIPDSGRLDFALSSPFDGNEKILIMEYPNGNDGTAASLTIPAVSTGGSNDEVWNSNNSIESMRIYKRSDGQAVLEFPVYATLDMLARHEDELNNLHFDSLELVSTVNMDNDTLAPSGLTMLERMTSKVYIAKDHYAPKQVLLPSRSESLQLTFYEWDKGSNPGRWGSFDWSRQPCNGKTATHIGYAQYDVPDDL